MCTTCGCAASDQSVRFDGEPASAAHAHAHGGPHDSHAHGLHHHTHGEGRRTVDLGADLLAKNDRFAAENRAWFRRHQIAAFNLIGAPGAGKTSLLEHTIRRLSPTVRIAVLEGDQETDHDAQRIRAAGCTVVQINTGAGCHLDAHMVEHGVERLKLPPRSLLLIENVGNLVCPALFDLGEAAKIAVMSVTEGEDKPEKYPHVFRAADVLVVTKTDLLPHLRFDLDRCLSIARRVNPRLRVFEVSTTSGQGFSAWCDWLHSQCVTVADSVVKS